MARNILKTNNTIVGIANTLEAFTTSNIDMNLYSFVQASTFDVTLSRQNIPQLGSQEFVSTDLPYQPDVNLEIAYMPEPRLFNESIVFFSKKRGAREAPSVLSGKSEVNTNFYFLNEPNEGTDALPLIPEFGDTVNLSGWEAMAFGNCYLTNYSLNYAVGALPIVSNSMICSNMRFQQVTGTSMESVAINLQSGNSHQVGAQEFIFDDGVKNPSILNPSNTGSIVTFQNLQVGGQPLGGIHCLQSISLNLALNRVSSYGLGSDYAYNRELQLPAQGSVTTSSLVSGFDYGKNSLTGFLSGVVNNESGYNLEFVLGGTGGWVGYTVEDAKLDSYTYSTAVNEVMTFDASFSFNVTEKGGLRISGSEA